MNRCQLTPYSGDNCLACRFAALPFNVCRDVGLGDHLYLILPNKCRACFTLPSRRSLQVSLCIAALPFNVCRDEADRGTRIPNRLITNQLLYLLSYIGITAAAGSAPAYNRYSVHVSLYCYTSMAAIKNRREEIRTPMAQGQRFLRPPRNSSSVTRRY